MVQVWVSEHVPLSTGMGHNCIPASTLDGEDAQPKGARRGANPGQPFPDDTELAVWRQQEAG